MRLIVVPQVHGTADRLLLLPARLHSSKHILLCADIMCYTFSVLLIYQCVTYIAYLSCLSGAFALAGVELYFGSLAKRCTFQVAPCSGFVSHPITGRNVTPRGWVQRDGYQRLQMSEWAHM